MNINYYIEIKDKLINNEIIKRAKDYSKNRSDLTTYYDVGKLLSEAGKHFRLLYRILKYYNFVSEEKLSTVSTKLLISHYDELLSLHNINKIKYYLNECENKNLTQRQLHELICN